MKIAVIDLDIGNLRSVEQALKTVAGNADVYVTNNTQEIEQADKVVLPGQGAIGSWFNAVETHGLADVIKQTIQTKPLLGICVGMQALFDFCEEDGGTKAMGVFNGEVKHFSHFHTEQIETLKIPQMGWNQVTQTQSHPLWNGIKNDAHFYFVHSYCANLNDDATDDVVLGSANYGHEFIAAVGRGNVFAVQFHPEKSHNDGLQLLKNFVEWDGSL